jgi:indolepyruvate ferredoxin oxidoreductase alpha subunit
MALKLMSGNAAIARGAWEAGVVFAAGYPGTPSTEVLEHLAQYDEVRAQWSVNEKVAFDEGVGAALGGLRTMVTMKHMGLNVASDAFMALP